MAIASRSYKEEPQFHYDIGYGGLFAHYRDIFPFKGDPNRIVEILKNLQSHMSTDKKGVMLEDLSGIMDCYKELQEAGFYMVNFETKSMAESGDFRTQLVTIC